MTTIKDCQINVAADRFGDTYKNLTSGAAEGNL